MTQGETANGAKRGRGKPPHAPTSEQRAQVEAMAAFGIRQDQIASYLSIDKKTLNKHYRAELDGAMVKANFAVARALHKMATGGNVSAAIFWTKARMGWTEKRDPDDDDNAPEPVKVTVNVRDARKRSNADAQ